jgi:hypothetical protein
MALLEDVLSGTAGGVLAGVAVVALAPAILPAELGLRALAKTVVKGVLVVTDVVAAVALRVSEQFGDLVIEARDEIATGARSVSL